MKLFRFPALALLLVPSILLAQELSPPADHCIKLWPGAAPGEPEGFQVGEETYPKRKGDQSRITSVRNVSVPNLHVFLPPATVESNGACVLIAPGGGYNGLAIGHEGVDAAVWLNSLGVTAAVLKYRIPRRDPNNPQLQPLMDAQRAMRLLRHHAADWKIDRDRVGMLGFSAGGNLTVFTGTSHQETTYEVIDEVDEHSSRPDFLVLIYPAYMQEDKKIGVDASSKVDADTPPTFVAVSHDDVYSPSSAALYLALNKAKVPAEMHVYPDGGHGWGMGRAGTRSMRWPVECAAWMRELGFLRAGKAKK